MTLDARTALADPESKVMRFGVAATTAAPRPLGQEQITIARSQPSPCVVSHPSARVRRLAADHFHARQPLQRVGQVGKDDGVVLCARCARIALW